MGVPRKKKTHLSHPQAELGFSHLCPVWDSNPHQPQRLDDPMIKCGNDTHSAEVQSTCSSVLCNHCIEPAYLCKPLSILT